MRHQKALGAIVQNRKEGRSALKRRAIVDAATRIFLQYGYLGTSMDQIAALAAVSKPTVYKHFIDKEQLFSEIVLRTIEVTIEPYFTGIESIADTKDVDKDLRDLAIRLLDSIMQPRLLQLRRLVTGESGRFPNLGRGFYERGPGRSAKSLASAFERLAARGLLQIEDPIMAARHFNWLVLSIPLNEAMLCGSDRPYEATDLRKFAEAGVRVFLRAYRKN